jgi:microcin C transport system substrate-binding protein
LQSLIPGDELFSYLHSSQKNIKGSRNLSGLDNKEIDNLVEKIAQARDKKTLKILCRKIDKIMLENYYTVLHWHNNSYRVLYRNIFGMPKAAPKYSLAFDTWWINNN